MKLTYIYTFLGIVLAAFASAGNEYTGCDFFGHCATYLNHTIEQAALTLVAVAFLIRGFIGLLATATISEETYQGSNIFIDNDIEKRDEYFRINEYNLYQKNFDADVGGF